MSTPIPDPVTSVEPEVKPAAIVDNVNDHTPDPKTPPVVDHVPDPPRPDVEGLTELRGVVEGLANTVASLTELVVGKTKDESPASVPWISKGPAIKHAWDED